MPNNEKRLEVVEEIPLYRGFFNLSRIRLRHTLYGGGWSPLLERELFHRGRAAAVIPYDPETDRVVLIEQFRIGALGHAPSPWLIEIVAGAVEEGETPEQVACREAREEAGCEIRALIPIAEFFATPGACSEKITLFCGLVDSRGVGGVHGLPEEQEDILARVLSFADAWACMEQGRIDSAIPIIALQWLALHRARLRPGPA